VAVQPVCHPSAARVVARSAAVPSAALIPTEPEYRKPAPHEYLPFSAGPHRCIGATFALTELTVMLARLLARTSLLLPEQRIRPTGFAAMRPARGLLVDVLQR